MKKKNSKYKIYIEKIILTIVLLNCNKAQLVIRLNQFRPLFPLNNSSSLTKNELPILKTNEVFLDIQTNYKQEQVNNQFNYI